MNFLNKPFLFLFMSVPIPGPFCCAPSLFRTSFPQQGPMGSNPRLWLWPLFLLFPPVFIALLLTDLHYFLTNIEHIPISWPFPCHFIWLECPFSFGNLSPSFHHLRPSHHPSWSAIMPITFYVSTGWYSLSSSIPNIILHTHRHMLYINIYCLFLNYECKLYEDRYHAFILTVASLVIQTTLGT